MARKKAKKEVERKELSIGTLVIYDDGTSQLIANLTEEDTEILTGGESEEEEADEDDDDEEEDSDDEDEEEDDEDDEDSDEEEEDGEEEDEIDADTLAEADFETMEDICEDQGLKTDPDKFDEEDKEDVEKLRKAIAKELGIKLPAKKAAAKGKGKGKGKK